MARDLDAIHDDLKARKQFCLRVGKQPYIKDGTRNTFTSTGWSENRQNWLTFEDAIDVLQRGVEVWHGEGYRNVEGIGFLVARASQDEPQILGGDLDCCRNPETGFISSWAVAFLKKLRPFYSELSPSKCGIRFFPWGGLPGGRDSIFGNGPQDDLPEESRERILAAKPKAREKLEKGEPVFNGLELYESGRHLTLTGWRIPEFCFPREDQTEAIYNALEPFLIDEAIGNAYRAKRQGRLPQLDILDVIDTSGFTASGGQLFGPHPTLGSTTGRNLVVDPSKGVYCWMHDGINAGGDAWIWLACECGAVPWEQAGSGVLKDRAILKKTLKHAVSRGLITEAEAGLEDDTQSRPSRKIQVNGRYLQEITADALEALAENNDPPKIFMRSGHLARLVSKDRLVIEPLNESALRGLLARAAGFVKYEGKDEETGEPKFTRARPPLDVVRDILSLGSWPGFPEIEGVIETPVLRPDGSILLTQGYDGVTRLYYASASELQRLQVPETPLAEDAKKAAQHILDEILVDFPFKDDASKANAYALLLSVIARPMIEGNVPLALLDKPQAGTGASFFAEIVAMIATCRPANMMGAPGTEDEWRKSITSSLLDGNPIIVIDNVTGKLHSSSLTRALTSRVWRDRFLGKSEMLDLPQRAVWIATGNNIAIGGDLARRSYWIRMDASMARPWTRTGFKHEDLLAWIKANHASILSDLLTMARAWVLAGRPEGSAKAIGGFKEWLEVIGGILEFAGIQGLLANASELYDSMDQDVQQWDAFLGEWAAIHADNLITAGRLKDELISIEQIYRTFQEAMPDEVADAVRKDRKATLSLGLILWKHVDQIYPSGRKLCCEKDTHTKVSLWKVAGSLENQESQSRDGFAGSAGSSPIRRSLREDESDSTKCIAVEQLPALPADQQQKAQSGKSQLPANPGGQITELQSKLQENSRTILDASQDGSSAGDGEPSQTSQLAWKLSQPRAPPGLEDPPSFCLACGEDTSPGHGSYLGGAFCTSCGPKLAMVRAAMKAHPGGLTLSKLWEDLAARGRAPRNEHLPGMLRYLGCVEEGGTWRWADGTSKAEASS